MGLYYVTTASSGIMEIPPIIEFKVKALLNYAYQTTFAPLEIWGPTQWTLSGSNATPGTTANPGTIPAQGAQLIQGIQLASGVTEYNVNQMLINKLGAAKAYVLYCAAALEYGLSITTNLGVVSGQASGSVTVWRSSGYGVEFTPNNPPTY